MLLKLFLIVSLLYFTVFNQLKAEDLTEESGDQPDDIDFGRERNLDGTDDVDDDSAASGDDGKLVPRVTMSVRHREPPAAVDTDEKDYKEGEDNDKEYDGNGGGGIVIDENEGDDVTAETNQWNGEPVHVQENSLITHPGILAAIIIGGVLVLVCLIVFFVLIVCCVRKKDEGTYDLDDAMKQKLKYVAYTKAETSPDKEFFA